MSILTLPELLAQYEAALEFLARLGVRVAATRLSKYQRVLRSAVECEARGIESHQSTEEFRNALVESADIIEIASIPASEFADRHTLMKLREVSSGREYMEEGQADPARDYGFEFVVGAELLRRGRFGGFSPIGGDVTIDVRQHPVECKRITSWAQLDRRVREAASQLAKCNGQGAPAGLIALDASRPIQRGHGRIEAASDAEMGELAEERTTAVVVQQVMRSVNPERVRSAHTLGVMVRCVSSGSAGGVGNIRRSTVWQAVCLHDDGTPENDSFLELADAFSGGPITNATHEDVARGFTSNVRT